MIKGFGFIKERKGKDEERIRTNNNNEINVTFISNSSEQSVIYNVKLTLHMVTVTEIS